MPALVKPERLRRPTGWASVGVGAAAVLLGLTAGCSLAPAGTSPSSTPTDGASDSGAASPAASTGTPIASTAPSTDAVSPPATPATPAAAACLTSRLRVRFADDEGGGAAGSVYGTITFTNISTGTCSLRGFPGVAYVGKNNGTQIGAAADHEGDTIRWVTVVPGKKAVATLRRTNAGNYSGECHNTSVNGLRIYPPGSTTSAFVKFPATGCSNKAVHLLSVGAVRPG
jgi:hypothetical protein